MEKLKVTINGREYALRTENRSRLEHNVSDLNNRIGNMSDALKSKTEDEILTLVALDILDDAGVQADKDRKEIARLIRSLAVANDALEQQAKSANAALSENITSAESELEQLASVKDEENIRLREKLMEYENRMSEVMDEREAAIERLQNSYQSAIQEMEQIAKVRDLENARLRQTLNSYESSFDLSMKTKEDEIRNLRAKVVKLSENRNNH